MMERDGGKGWRRKRGKWKGRVLLPNSPQLPPTPTTRRCTRRGDCARARARSRKRTRRGQRQPAISHSVPKARGVQSPEGGEGTLNIVVRVGGGASKQAGSRWEASPDLAGALRVWAGILCISLRSLSLHLPHPPGHNHPPPLSGCHEGFATNLQQPRINSRVRDEKETWGRKGDSAGTSKTGPKRALRNPCWEDAGPKEGMRAAQRGSCDAPSSLVSSMD
ncbi:hypothetical protein BO71DRAFT_174363 [Aspergillus ellipticus CBS 707.79]|uniref:Uncharacterized protein n=1 Tax=Aspergillus ellipticus CBS 707.79 TaxID=1448320 RepID=A0A319DYL8_9EURO|nr:hypothetical protein BO71DRAFT_174363 [Aspergillus ellipticus CBS 707.79]